MSDLGETRRWAFSCFNSAGTLWASAIRFARVCFAISAPSVRWTSPPNATRKIIYADSVYVSVGFVHKVLRKGRLGDGHSPNKELRDALREISEFCFLSSHRQQAENRCDYFFICQPPLSFLAWLRSKRVMPCLPALMK